MFGSPEIPAFWFRRKKTKKRTNIMYVHQKLPRKFVLTGVLHTRFSRSKLCPKLVRRSIRIIHKIDITIIRTINFSFSRDLVQYNPSKSSFNIRLKTVWIVLVFPTRICRLQQTSLCMGEIMSRNIFYRNRSEILYKNIIINIT